MSFSETHTTMGASSWILHIHLCIRRCMTFGFLCRWPADFKQCSVPWLTCYLKHLVFVVFVVNSSVEPSFLAFPLGSPYSQGSTNKCNPVLSLWFVRTRDRVSFLITMTRHSLISCLEVCLYNGLRMLDVFHSEEKKKEKNSKKIISSIKLEMTLVRL